MERIIFELILGIISVVTMIVLGAILLRTPIGNKKQERKEDLELY